MNVSLTPELEKIVTDKVATGRYTSASEVIREALQQEIQKGSDALKRGDSKTYASAKEWGESIEQRFQEHNNSLEKSDAA